MAEEENFDDLDIYGDGTGEEYAEPSENPTEPSNLDGAQASAPAQSHAEAGHTNGNQAGNVDGAAETQDTSMGQDGGQAASSEQDQTQAIASTSGETAPSGPPKQAPVQQGVKRKEGESDEREVAPNATSALLISDLHWYQDEDDIRGWCNQARVEDEIKEITFNEHKVNGKSKGQVFVALQTPQAATALKQKVESFSAGNRKHTATFHPPNNPYKTLPKENPNRRDGNMQARGNFQGGRGNFNRGGFNQRGGMGQAGFNQNRNFSTPGAMGGGFNGNMGGAAMAGGFNGGMGMGGFNNNFNRGGMMGAMNRGGMMNRGGRGGMMGGMGAMGMGAMGGNMMGGGMMGGPMGGMGMGMAGMGMGGAFGGQQQPHFNPAFLNSQQQGGMGGDWGNNPNKRQRQE